MRLASWIRTELWPARDWRQALSSLCDRTVHDAASTAVRATDLAHACELVEPDRRRALAMHRVAARLGAGGDALARATDIARELGDHATLAELALATFEASLDATWLLAAGVAFIDAGMPQLASDPLARALAVRPWDEEAKSALNVIRGELRDPHSVVSSWVTRASRANRTDSARMYLHAARLARVAGLDAIYARHLDAAVLRGAGQAATLIEARLLEGRNAEPLLAFYRSRVEAATSDRDWVDTMRAAGCKLFANNVHRGLAVRLLRSGLEHAYRSRLADVPAHLASWDLLTRHARDTLSTRELMPLVVEAMARSLPEDDRLYLARVGFQVTRHDAGDSDAARPYAVLVAELVPDDPDVREFISTDVLDLDAAEIWSSPAELEIETPPRVAAPPPPPPPRTVAVVPQRPLPEATPTPAVVQPTVPTVSTPAVVQPTVPTVSTPAPVQPTVPTISTPTVVQPTVPTVSTPSVSTPTLVQPTVPTTSTPAPVQPTVPTMSTPTLVQPTVSTPVPVQPTVPTMSTPAPVQPTVSTPAPVPRSLIPAAAIAALSAGNRPIGLPVLPKLPVNPARKAERVVVPVDVDVRLQSGDAFAAIVRDLSATGLFVVTDRAVDIGAVVKLELRLPGTNLLTQSSHDVAAKVVRRAQTGYGMLLLEPSRELANAIAALAVRDPLAAL